MKNTLSSILLLLMCSVFTQGADSKRIPYDFLLNLPNTLNSFQSLTEEALIEYLNFILIFSEEDPIDYFGGVETAESISKDLDEFLRESAGIKSILLKYLAKLSEIELGLKQLKATGLSYPDGLDDLVAIVNSENAKNLKALDLKFKQLETLLKKYKKFKISDAKF